VVMEGAPVAGAKVGLVNALTNAGILAMPIAVTDASGRFDLGPQLATTYMISASAPRATEAMLALNLADPSVLFDDLTLVVHSCDASVHGTLRDLAGGEVRGRVA